jgi:hypothetical protein
MVYLSLSGRLLLGIDLLRLRVGLRLGLRGIDGRAGEDQEQCGGTKI